MLILFFVGAKPTICIFPCDLDSQSKYMLPVLAFVMMLVCCVALACGIVSSKLTLLGRGARKGKDAWGLIHGSPSLCFEARFHWWHTSKLDGPIYHVTCSFSSERIPETSAVY